LFLFACVFFLFLIANARSASAATYYVDATTGLDTDTGLTEDLAWQTISKVNTSSFNHGDNILFKRGEGWREQMSFPSSGISGSPITIGDYGSGVKPTIYGSSLLDGSWTLVGGTIYKISLATEAKTVLNGTSNLILSDGNYATLGSNQWDWYSNELYVNIGSDPTGGNIEAGQRSYGILLIGKNYITIENVIIRNVNQSGTYLYNGCNNIIVNNVEGYSNGNEAFKQADTTSVTYNNIIGNYNLDDGFSLHDSATATINTGTFNNNIAGIQNIGTSQISINNVTVQNNTTTGINIGCNSCTNTIDTALIESNNYNLNFSGNQVVNLTNITINGGAYGLYSSSSNTITSNGLYVSDTTDSGVYLLGTGDTDFSRLKISGALDHAVDLIVVGTKFNVNNCLLYNNLGTAKYAIMVRTGTTASVKNCVLYNNTRGLYVVNNTELYNTNLSNMSIAVLISTPNLLTLSNNNFYNNTTDFSTPMENTNGISVNPLFVNAVSGDFRLQRTSELINAGTDMGLTIDYAGNSVPQGTAPDIGAYEFMVPNFPSSLVQYNSDGTTAIATGSWIDSTTVVLKFNMSSSNASDSLVPQVEIKEVGENFTNTVTEAGNVVTYSGTPVNGVVTVSGLSPNKDYHWQARSSNAIGESTWISYGGNSESRIDFGLGIKDLNVVITDLGFIDNVPDMEELYYYFTSQTPIVKGICEVGNTIHFKYDDNDYTTTCDSNGEFTLIISNPSLPRGEVELIYYQVSSFGNKSSERILTLMIGVENFPEWLLEKLGLSMETGIEISDDQTDEEITEVEKANLTTQSEIQEETNPKTDKKKEEEEDKGTSMTKRLLLCLVPIGVFLGGVGLMMIGKGKKSND